MQARHKIIADLLAKLGYEVIVEFDRREPEYAALSILRDQGTEPPYLALAAVSTGVVDYRLARGGAEKLWNALVQASGGRSLNSIPDVYETVMKVLDQPVCALLNRQKRRRVNRLYQSGYAAWLVENYDEVSREPMQAWRRLASALRNRMYQKTVVFAVKALDIAHFISHGRYLPLPPHVPLPVDFHVRNITISAGLLPDYVDDQDYVDAWAKVLEELNAKLEEKINLLRLDSIAWQLGKTLYKAKYHPEESRRRIVSRLVEMGADPRLAEQLAQELTRYIHKVDPRKAGKC